MEFFLVLIILAALILYAYDKGARQKCPHCAQWINKEAKVCPQCHKDLPVLKKRLPTQAVIDRQPNIATPSTSPKQGLSDSAHNNKTTREFLYLAGAATVAERGTLKLPTIRQS